MDVVRAHGAGIPAIGLGTWTLRGRDCARIVADAIGLGYRHVDTAAGYGNETEVGEGIRAAGLARSEIFVTTKISPENLADGALQKSVEASLKRLGLDFIDLVLIHWPSPRLSVAATIGPLNEVKRRGLARHIGVSNFTPRRFAEAWAATSEPIVANQCEYHPHLDQDRLIALCREKGTAFIAYCPLGRGVAFREPVIADIARRKGRTPAQVALRWEIQQPDVIAIPKSSRIERLKENLDVFGFTLDAAEMAAISALGKKHHDRICESSLIADWDD